jgi:hypothetical protein
VSTGSDKPDAFGAPAADDRNPPREAGSRADRPAGETVPAPFVLVLGMHRSGTSLCSHLLAGLGIDMADEADAQPSNPKGHWERPEIVARHDRILELFGRAYLSPLHDLPLPPGWSDDPRVTAIRRELVALLRQKITAGRPSGFKDPRTARLLPLWHQIFDELGVTPKVLLCVRNPAQVARSLSERDGLPADTGEYRWFVYMAEIFENLPDWPTCMIAYEDWFSDTGDNPARLSYFLGLSPPAAVQAAAGAVVERRLRHDDPSDSGPRQALVRSLYELVRRCDSAPAARQEIAQMVAQFSAFRQLQQPIAEELQQVSRLVMPLAGRDWIDAHRALSWRDPVIAGEWKKFTDTAARAEALRDRLQVVLKQRAELDATLARFQQSAALHDRAAELAKQEITALRRQLATQDAPASAASDSLSDETGLEAGRSIAEHDG